MRILLSTNHDKLRTVFVSSPNMILPLESSMRIETDIKSHHTFTAISQLLTFNTTRFPILTVVGYLEQSLSPKGFYQGPLHLTLSTLY